jgi:hypothetical protein
MRMHPRFASTSFTDVAVLEKSTVARRTLHYNFGSDGT